MNKLVFILSLFLSTATFAQEAVFNGFVGLHYTGLTYQTVGTDTRGWNSGFGAMVGVRPGRSFSVELAYELTPIREERHYQHTLYHSPAQLFSLNFGLGWQWEKVDLRFLFGPGFRWTGKIDRTYYHPQLPIEKAEDGEGRLSPAFNFGMRGMYNINERFSATLALYGNFRFPHDESNPHYTKGDLYPLNSPALIYINAGIAYRFEVK